MAQDSLPTIAADPDRAGRPRRGGGRGRGGSSSLLFVNAILVVLVVALVGAGWFIFEQQQRIVRGEEAAADASRRIGMLEERLRMTDEVMSESDTDISTKLSEWINQTDLLWANYRKLRDGIKALEARDKELTTSIARADGSVKAVQGKTAALEAAIARQQDVADRLTELDIQVQKAIKQLRNVADKSNAAHQIASRLEDSLADQVTQIQTDIRAIDAHRAQVNADIAELKRQVDNLRFSSP